MNILDGDFFVHGNIYKWWSKQFLTQFSVFKQLSKIESLIQRKESNLMMQKLFLLLFQFLYSEFTRQVKIARLVLWQCVGIKTSIVLYALFYITSKFI